MKLQIPVFIVAFFSTTFCAFSEDVVVSGVDSSYAGVEIKLKYYVDEISASEGVLAIDTVSSSGSYKLKFQLDEITYVFADCGKYRMYYFVEPGQTYKIVLPPRQDKTPEDKLNPFFNPIAVHLATEEYNDKDLNVQIRLFNDAYIPFYNKHLEDVYKKKDFHTLDTDIKKMDKSFSKSEHTFFNQYRRYRYGLIRYLAYQQKSKSISNEYFKDQPVLLNNPAYMELFNLLYDKYFQHFSRTEEGKNISLSIKNRDINALRKTLSSDNVLKPENLRDLVILKGLYDEFYDDNYSRSALLEILDNYITNTKNTEQIKVAKSIRKKVTKLLVGFEPPAFELLDRNNNLVSLDKFKGKFVYLNFCTCFSYSCLNEFAMLKTLYEKHKEYLEIVTIVADDDQQTMKSFLERSGYQWVFLHDGLQPELLEKYDIRAFPTYYLIDNEGKLIMSPAPAPQEEFEGRLFKVLRAKGVL